MGYLYCKTQDQFQSDTETIATGANLNLVMWGILNDETKQKRRNIAKGVLSEFAVEECETWVSQNE